MFNVIPALTMRKEIDSFRYVYLMVDSRKHRNHMPLGLME